MVFTPDSKYAILGTARGSILMFDTQQNQVSCRLNGAHSGSF